MIGNWGPGSYKFTPADFRILQSIESSPRKAYNVIASEVDMTPRQVKWRLDKMTEARALFVVQIRNYRALSGILKADLLVCHEPESRRQVNNQIAALLGDRTFDPHSESDTVSFFAVLMTNISERREILRDVRGIKGVVEAYLDIQEDLIFRPETFKGLERPEPKQLSVVRRANTRRQQD